MAVIDAAARSRGEAGASVVAIVRRDLRFADVVAAVRQQLWLVAISVLLVLLAPGWYARLTSLRGAF
jgi:hypothetical protein